MQLYWLITGEYLVVVVNEIWKLNIVLILKVYYAHGTSSNCFVFCFSTKQSFHNQLATSNSPAASSKHAQYFIMS